MGRLYICFIGEELQNSHDSARALMILVYIGYMNQVDIDFAISLYPLVP